jgi:hypothetical protein
MTTKASDLRTTAHHEAAHAVVLYRTTGSAGGTVSIMPNVEEGEAGSAMDYTSDRGHPADVEGMILRAYAGGHAQRMIAAASGDTGCGSDDEQAADLLRLQGWEHREQELRDRSLALVRQHWTEIVAVAEELLRVEVLDETEVEILADGAAGDPTARMDLERYRVLAEKGK